MTWGIIGAMDSEVALLRDSMEVERTEEISGLTYYIGTLCGQKVIVVCCSIGKVNAAICAQTLAAVFKVDRLVNVGVAGALDERLRIFDVVVSEKLCYHDADLDIFERNPPFVSEYAADKDMVRLAEQACEKIAGTDFRCFGGRIVSGDRFVSENAEKQRIVGQFHPMCVEMEGAAVGHVAAANKIPFVVIRSMSDGADDNAGMSFDEFAPKAAEHSAKIVMEMLKLA
ncbi:MAG: 5'-methylthioadenosine/adenosylhomocysteine nucleosidase [Oscillospiraceae bacterium]|jgi:adenosylhomocysteine nucleosidase|nr:5'-methylthioadenosine/adenosylhomocysteine nucleosidase [Oscillospiraceae bacterium]